MANKKLKLLYLAQYLFQETNEDHPKTIRDITDYLESHDISAERKSIYSDIEALRDEYHLDIQSVKGKHFGYFLGERHFQLPELKMLTDVVQASPFLSKSKSMDLIGKLEQLTSRYDAKELHRQVYVMNRLRTENETLYYAVDAINRAISENCKLSFRYFQWTPELTKQYRHDGAAYLTNPVSLCVEQNYYLVAYDEATGQYRHYRVDRMSDLRVLEDTPRAPLPQDFDLGSYTRRIFAMYTGESVTIRLRMEKSCCNAALDRFGADVHMHSVDEGHFELTAEIIPSPTFYGWLFQFGPQAKLLSPQSAVDGFKNYCRETLAQYE